VFDLETGEPVDGPARDPVPLYAAREVDGWIEVTLTPVA
jgi:nitrite reductase/ring-hydroxylating ferredoxin subunit